MSLTSEWIKLLQYAETNYSMFLTCPDSACIEIILIDLDLKPGKATHLINTLLTVKSRLLGIIIFGQNNHTLLFQYEYGRKKEKQGIVKSEKFTLGSVKCLDHEGS